MFDNHIIPPNVSDLGGMLSAGTYRRIIESAAIAGTGLIIAGSLMKNLSIAPRAFVMAVFIVPSIIALAGIGGRPLTGFLRDYIKYKIFYSFFPYKLPMPLEYKEDKRQAKAEKKRQSTGKKVRKKRGKGK